MNFSALFSWIISAAPVWDVLLMFVFLAAGFFYGIFLGRARLLAFMLALYASIPISRAIELFSEARFPIKFGSLTEFFSLILFIGVAGATYLLFYISLFRNRRLGDGGWWQILIASFLATGLALAEIGHLLPADFQNKLSETAHMLLLSDIAYMCWLITPLVGMYIASRRVE